MPNVTNLEGAYSYSDLAAKAEELGIRLVVPGPDNVIVDGVQAFFQDRM